MTLGLSVAVQLVVDLRMHVACGHMVLGPRPPIGVGMPAAGVAVVLTRG